MPGPDYLGRNRRAWNRWAERYARAAPRNWESEPHWGVFAVPDTEVGILPADLRGRDVVELGCGTAYVSAWCARRGARPVGLDNAPDQLATARAMQTRYHSDFPLLLAAAESLPLADCAFDLAISEYGAAQWSDPYRWLPEAFRVLRPGGRLVFLVTAPLLVLCEFDDENVPADAWLKRDYFGLHRVEWDDGEDAVEFHLPHGEMIRCLRGAGFEIVDLIELRPPPDARTGYGFVDAAWASRWPAEEIWIAARPR